MRQPPRPQVSITFAIPAAVFTGLVDLARKAGQPRDLYTANLLIAAYSAKLGGTGDLALERAVRAPAQESPKPPPRALTNPLASEITRLTEELAKARREVLEATARHTIGEVEAGRLRRAVQERDEHAEQALRELNALAAEHEAIKNRLTAAEAERDRLVALAKTIDPPKPAAAPPSPQAPQGQMADCARRAIIALRAAGLAPYEIARETDTPLEAVRDVLAAHRKGAKA